MLRQSVMAVPKKLSAKDPSSFAYKTIKERLPVIIVKTLDFFCRKKRELHTYGGTVSNPTEEQLAEIEADAKCFVTMLGLVRKLVETNKPLSPLIKLDLPPELEYFNDDIDAWNAALFKEKTPDGVMPKWFEASWLLVESYLYRYIKQISLNMKQLKMFDPFVEQKQAAAKSSVPQMIIVANYLKNIEKATLAADDKTHPNERNEFVTMVQLALWANKSDLSLSCNSAVKSDDLSADIEQSLETLRRNILSDKTPDLYHRVERIKTLIRNAPCESEEVIYVDLVADNSGYELFVDLCLMHFLSLVFCPVSLGSSLVRLRLHLKRMPWYVSDTMRPDLDWLLKWMQEPQQDEILKELGERWRSFFDSGFWEIHDHMFWTMPHEYAWMPTVAPDLYKQLQLSRLAIFKGDLNYRKLTGDRSWNMLTHFAVALRDFEPTAVAAIRTLKADTVVGIDDIDQYTRINNNELPNDWMISGEFGLIQFCKPKTARPSAANIKPNVVSRRSSSQT